MKVYKLNTDGFLLSAGYVMNDFTLLEQPDNESFKERVKFLVRRGCTTVFAYSDVRTVNDLQVSLKKARHQMINSTIDYVLGITVVAKALTPELIRRCKREKVPVIRLLFSSLGEMNRIPWSRMKEELLTYPLLLIPNLDQFTDKDKVKAKKAWRRIINKYRLPSSLDFPESCLPFPKVLVKKVGLFPKKGELVVSGDLDYSLFQQGSTVAQSENLDYDKGSPDVVVMRGRVLKAGEQLYYKPGFGKEIKVTVPGHFVPISEAYQ